jgi:hypothetical protein
VQRSRVGTKLREEIVVAARVVGKEQAHVGIGDDVRLDERLPVVGASFGSQVPVQPIVEGSSVRRAG